MNAMQDRPMARSTAPIAPPPGRNLGNDVTNLNDTLGRTVGALETAVHRLRGPVPVQGECQTDGDRDVSLCARVNDAEHAAERAESLAKEIVSLLGE